MAKPGLPLSLASSSPLEVFSSGMHMALSVETCLSLTDMRNRYDTGTISGILAMPYWQQLFSTGYRNAQNLPDVSPAQTSAVVSILSAGTFFGALASGFMADITGRKLALMLSTIVFTFGVILQTAAVALPLFLAGRFFAGLGVGLLSAQSK